MPTFEVEQYEIHSMKYQVEASSEAEAIIKVLAGEADAVDNSLEFIEVAEEFGMSTEGAESIVKELIQLGESVLEDFISSVRGVKQLG